MSSFLIHASPLNLAVLMNPCEFPLMALNESGQWPLVALIDRARENYDLRTEGE